MTAPVINIAGIEGFIEIAPRIYRGSIPFLDWVCGVFDVPRYMVVGTIPREWGNPELFHPK